MTDLSSAIKGIEERIRAAEQVSSSTSGDSESVILVRERSAIRTHTTKVVIWLYAIILGAVVIFIIASGFITKDIDHTEAQLTDLIKTALIPIVTFVIGHYFGSTSR